MYMIPTNKETEYRTIKWDRRFLRLAEYIAEWSRDPSTKCGAVIVRPDKTIASVGFNGFPQGCDDSEEYYQDRETKYSRIIHAEVNAILSSKEPLRGYTIYTWPAGFGPTCDRCATVIIQSGINRVVHIKDESAFAERWKEVSQSGLKMYEEAGVEVFGYYEPW